MSAALLDCTVRFHGPGDYRYSATFRVGARDIRVRLCRDDDRSTAFAVAETLDDGLRWTRLLKADPPPPTRHRGGRGDVVRRLEGFARELAGSAELVPTRREGAA